jgi:beta-glucosidase
MADALDPELKQQQSTPFSRVEHLLAEMSVSEKVGQMTQHAFMAPLQEEPKEFERVLEQVRQGRVGSFLNAPSLAVRNQLQRAAVEQSRLGIPLMFGRDVIHGYRTIFPIPLGLAASFDPDLAEATCQAAAAEASEAGIDWTFAPMVDVTRDPRWGRVAEGFGEDPFLASLFGAAMVRGFQGSDPAAPGRVAACAKHYLGYGASEAGKEYNATSIPERLLRDVYLPSFRACVDAGVLTVMCGFNDLDGVPMSGNRWALRELLKGELGFQGFVVSDWTSPHELIAHGFCSDDRQVALESVHAGLDMEMESRAYQTELVRLVEGGQVTLQELNDSVRRILEVKHRLGLFERPFTPEAAPSVALCKLHLELARKAARASLVLLKNEKACLPLSPDIRSVALIGPLADDQHHPLGCWSFDGDRSATVSLLAALKERLGPSVRLTHVHGLPEARSLDESGFDAALRAVDDAEVAIALVGEDANMSGECHSRAFLGLPGAQSALLRHLASSRTPLVVIVMAGRPLTLNRDADAARALLYAWHPGSMGGPALVDVLFGDAAPSGKLPISFPRTVGQVPVYYNYKNTGRPPRTDFRGIPQGTPLDPVDMDASYLDVEVTPHFPFGYGLTYTHFEYSELAVSPARAGLTGSIEVSVRLRNVGTRTGVEVVQLYVRDRVGSVTRPVRELKGFQRVELGAGASLRVTFQLAASELAFCGRDLRVRTEPGSFEAYVGGDSRASLMAEFELHADDV